jgi:hypothetical protein
VDTFAKKAEPIMTTRSPIMTLPLIRVFIDEEILLMEITTHPLET